MLYNYCFLHGPAHTATHSHATTSHGRLASLGALYCLVHRQDHASGLGSGRQCIDLDNRRLPDALLKIVGNILLGNINAIPLATCKNKTIDFFFNSKFGYFKYSVFSVTSGHVVVHEPSTHISNKQLQLRTCWQLHRKVPAHKTKQEICTHSQLVRKSTHYGTTVGVRKSCQDKHALAEEERSYSTEQQFFLAVAYKKNKIKL